ncbi:MarR family transcriptional regulator [Gammaproteobacteria bacterium]|nr:MarR family transcriptional regulator [Gammaproteobacteria bacterium]
MTSSLVPMTEIDDILNVRIVRLAAKLSLAFQREALQPTGLTLQEWRLIFGLAQHGDNHLRGISRLIQLDPAHTSRVAQQLEENDYLRKDTDPNDSRKILLSLTQKGNESFLEIWPKAYDFSIRQKEALGTEKFAVLKSILDDLTDYADNSLEVEY